MQMQNRTIYAVILFLIACAIGLYFHEFWCDEAYTCLLINASSSLSGMIENFAYVGHPISWYLLMYLFQHLFNGIVGIQIANLIFISIAIFILCRYAPFTFAQKILFMFGFYPLYQYGMNSRPYSFIILLLFLFCAIRPKMYIRPMLTGIVLAVLASVHALSFVFVLNIIFVEFIIHKVDKKTFRSPAVYLALVILFLSAAWTFYQLLPPDGMIIKGCIRDANFLFFFKSIANGFFPNFHILHKHPVFQTVVGLILWSLSWFCFSGRKWGLLYYVSWTLIMVGFVSFVYKGFIWQHGLYYILFVASVWIGAMSGAAIGRKTRYYLVILFSVHAMMGVYAYGYDLLYPVSSGKHTAEYIRSHGLEKMNMLGLRVLKDKNSDEDRYSFEINQIQSTLVYLDNKEIYDPASKNFRTFWKYFNFGEIYYKQFTGEEMVKEVREISDELGTDLLIPVLRLKMTDTVNLPNRFKKLADFPTGDFYGESMSLYIYERQ